MDQKQTIEGIRKQLDVLLKQQEQFKVEIQKLKAELDGLTTSKVEPSPIRSQPAKPSVPVIAPQFKPPLRNLPDSGGTRSKKSEPEKPPFDLEQFIGGNLINKVGIVILILGLGLFVKYAIDKGYFPPAVRVIGGFVAGLALLGIAYRLKDKFRTYSAVLFSGGMAVMYFTSFIGYAFFEPPVLALLIAFILMLAFTVITIVVAGFYDAQIIGLIGLLGAYAVPFLVNDGSENYPAFFSYVMLINGGIVFLAIKKDWRLTTWLACLLTWVIMLFSYISMEETPVEQVFSWIYITVNFTLFLAAFLRLILKKAESRQISTSIPLAGNALAFFIFSGILTSATFGDSWVGKVFFLHAFLHFALAWFINKKYHHLRAVDLMISMGIVFFTFAIPAEFDQELTVAGWLAVATTVFYFGKKYSKRLLLIINWFIVSAALTGLIYLWSETYYEPSAKFTPFINVNLLVGSLAVAASFLFQLIDKKYPSSRPSEALGTWLYFIPLILIYFLFFNEILHALKAVFWEKAEGLPFGNADTILEFQELWLYFYTLVFLGLLEWLNLKFVKNIKLSFPVLIVWLIFTTFVLSAEMGRLNDLRDLYILDAAGNHWFLWIRYCLYAAIGFGLMVTTSSAKNLELSGEFRHFLQLVPHLIILAILSHEVITWTLIVLDSTQSPIPFRVGLSILWGLYSFILIGLGIRQKRKVLRIAGMVLFGITIIKVFLFDLKALSLISRTIIFIGLGVLLLLSSYFYQRFNKVNEIHE